MTEHDVEIVVTAETEFEARTLAAVLEDAGIDASVVPPPPAHGLRVDKPITVPVQVHRSDLEAARTVLAENRESAAELDWDEVDVGDAPPDASEPHQHYLPRVARAVALTVITLVIAAVVLWLLL